MNMTAKHTAEVSDIMEGISRGTRDALRRVERIGSAGDMSDDEFKALAKEVEEVGELVRQLENINPHIVPALFEVPHGKWKGWSGLANYRNTLVHEFRTVTHEELLARVMNKLSLQEVADLLETVTSVGMMTKSFNYGSESVVKSLPRTSERLDLLPGSSVVVLRFEEAGELMAARSWRDERDNWRASIRWVRTQAENDYRLVLGLHDIELLLAPQVMSSNDDENEDSYNLLSVPIQPYLWYPKVLSQTDGSLEREKKRS